MDRSATGRGLPWQARAAHDPAPVGSDPAPAGAAAAAGTAAGVPATTATTPETAPRARMVQPAADVQEIISSPPGDALRSTIVNHPTSPSKPPPARRGRILGKSSLIIG